MKIQSYSETFPKRVNIPPDLDTYFHDWLCTFQQEELKDSGEINNKFLDDFARALCDDCPFGYEASHRIARWIFVYFNKKKNK